MKELTKALGNNWNLFKGDANPLYDAYIVEADKPANVKSVTSKISKLSGIEKATYGGANTAKLFQIAQEFELGELQRLFC